MVSSTSAIARPTQCPNTPMRCSMRAESGGLTIPMVVSTTTATTTNTAAIENPIHQRKAANASGRSRRVARRHHRLCGAA